MLLYKTHLHTTDNGQKYKHGRHTTSCSIHYRCDNDTMYQLPRALRLRQHASLFRPAFRHTPRQHQRNFSQIQRLARPAILSGGEPIRYQAVRFQRGSFFTWRRAITLALYGGAAYAYLELVARFLDVQIEILEEDVADEKDETKDREGKEVTEEVDVGEGPFYADEDSTFIPLTFPTKSPRAYYRGSDPEWQEFVKVARDKPRHKKIQNELVQIVYTGCTQHPAISRQLGPEAKVGKYWLDISFPDGPPQEYERSGVEIGEGFVAWSQQKVSPEEQWRLARALWPRAMFESLYATGRIMFAMQYRQLKQALGWEGPNPTSPEEKYRHAIEMIQKRQQMGRERKGVGSSTHNSQTPDGLPLVGASASADSAAPASESAAQSAKPSAAGPKDGNKSPWQISIPLPAAPTDAPIALHVFGSTLSKNWNPKQSEPPRGSFVVQGLVEVRGKRGRMLFDVQSCYDPRQGKFVAVGVTLRPGGFKRWNQRPRGGM